MRLPRVGFFESNQDPLQRCSRCRVCELICGFSHYQVGNPKRSRIRVVSLGRGKDVPVTCINCRDAPCVNVCPTGAMHRPEGVETAVVDQDLCIGCSICVSVCPVGAVTLDLVSGTAIKCDLCGDDPQCVKYCPAQVLKVTDAQGVAEFARERFARFFASVDNSDFEPMDKVDSK